MIFVANPAVSCFELANSMLLLGVWRILGIMGIIGLEKGTKNKRSHKNKWFLNIILTGINTSAPNLTDSTGFVTKNQKYFSPITSRICKCSIFAKLSFFRHPVDADFTTAEKTFDGI